VPACSLTARSWQAGRFLILFRHVIFKIHELYLWVRTVLFYLLAKEMNKKKKIQAAKSVLL